MLFWKDNADFALTQTRRLEVAARLVPNTTRLLAQVFQGLLDLVQPILESAELGLFHPLLFFSLYFSRLPLLLFALERLESRLALGKPTFDLFPVGWRILSVVYEIFRALYLGRQLRTSRLRFSEFCAGVSKVL